MFRNPFSVLRSAKKSCGYTDKVCMFKQYLQLCLVVVYLVAACSHL